MPPATTVKPGSGDRPRIMLPGIPESRYSASGRPSGLANGKTVHRLRTPPIGTVRKNNA